MVDLDIDRSFSVLNEKRCEFSVTVTMKQIFVLLTLILTIILIKAAPKNLPKLNVVRKGTKSIGFLSNPFHEHHNNTTKNAEQPILSDENIYHILKREVRDRSWLHHHQKLKIFLTTFSSGCIIFELFETFLERIPLLHQKLKFFMKLRIGVLFLCLSHLLHLLNEFIEKLEDREEFLHYVEKKEKIQHLLDQSFTDEAQAAKAYDRAAIELFSTDAILNFHYPPFEKDENGNYPLKLSKYRGVKYNNKLNAWQVDENYLGI